MSERKYCGVIKADKFYKGKKTINIVISKIEARKLAEYILDAAEETDNIDLKLDFSRPYKNGQFPLTVTYLENV